MRHFMLLIVLMLLLPLGSGFAQGKRALNIPIYHTPVNLDPAKIEDTFAAWVSRQVNCQLIRSSASSPRLEIAKSVRYLSPWKVVMTLKKGLKFNNGSPITAEDVVASYNYLDRHQLYTTDISHWLQKIYAISKEEVIFELHKPASAFIQLLGLHNLPIYQKAFLAKAEKNPDLWYFPVTCGGYKVVENNKKQLKLQPKFNTHPITFWGMNRFFIKPSEYQKFDIINGYFVSNKAKIPGFHRMEIFEPYQIFLGLNLTKKRWQNKQTRCEFLASLNQNIVKSRYGRLAQTANDFFPVGVVGYRKEYQFNAKIKEHYFTPKKNKLDDFCLAFLTISVPKAYRKSYVDMIKQVYDIKHFSIKNYTRVSRYKGFIKSNCDAIAIGFQSDVFDGYDFLVLFSKNGKSFTNFNNQSFSNELLASQDLNDNQQKALRYQKLADQLRDQCIVMPIVTLPMQVFFVKDSLNFPNIGQDTLEDYYLGDIV